MGCFSACSLAWLLLLSLPLLAEAGRNFWLLQQRVWQQREVQAMKEVYYRRQLLRGPSQTRWTPPIEGTIRQPLDHFNRQEKRSFNQRFWINEEHWQLPAGPIFLYIGGESALSPYAALSGHYVELAQKYGALVVAVEHRFYGASINLDGLKDENLQFLSSQQALADLAAFHGFITQKYSLTQRNIWICFGGSYPGNLAAWFRLKFPHLVFAAVASSAPVRAELDFTGYNKVVSASLSDPVVGGSPECRQAVSEAFSAVDGMVRSGRLAELARDYHSCEPLAEPDDQAELVANLADIFMGTVQYNGEWAQSVGKLCGIMTGRRNGSAYQRLVAVNNAFMETEALSCVENSHRAVLEELRQTNLSLTGVGQRQWYFQTCTEFGYYQTCEDASCPFSRLMTLQSYLNLCSQVFGISPGSVLQAVAFTNEYYGADHPKASRVLFVNGDIDPWHALSVLKNQSRSEQAIYINGTSHCANMRPSSSTDPLPLILARTHINDHVREWLKLARSTSEES